MTGLRFVAALALACVALISTTGAEARHRQRAVYADPMCNITMPCEGVTTSARGERVVRAMGGFGVARPVYRARVSAAHPRAWEVVSSSIVSHPAGCPARAFCGCGAAVRIFGQPIRNLWLAANWFKFPRAAPAPGMAAVRAHHVFVLEAHLGGDVWQVYDANSGGHATRIHARSIAGYAIVNPRAG